MIKQSTTLAALLLIGLAAGTSASVLRGISVTDAAPASSGTPALGNFPQLIQDLGLYLPYPENPVQFRQSAGPQTFTASIPDHWKCGNNAFTACLTDGNLGHVVDPKTGEQKWVDQVNAKCPATPAYGVCSFGNTDDISFQCYTKAGGTDINAYAMGTISGVAPDLLRARGLPSHPVVDFTARAPVKYKNVFGATEAVYPMVQYVYNDDWQTIDARGEMTLTPAADVDLVWSCTAQDAAAIYLFACTDDSGVSSDCSSSSVTAVTPASAVMATPAVTFHANAGQPYRFVVVSGVGSYTDGAVPSEAAQVRCSIRNAAHNP